MAGYGVAEKRIEKNRKPQNNSCGTCGEPTEKGQVLCQACADDVFFGQVIDEVENG
jgi:hypothetical protein